MPVIAKAYSPEKFVSIEGITYIYIQTIKLNSGQTKEYYRCEFCGARLHVFKDTLKCQLMRAHTSEDCAEARKKWEEKGKKPLGKGDIARLESILDDTSSASSMALNGTDDEEDEEENDEPSCIFDLTDATIIANDSNDFTLALAKNDQTNVSELESGITELSMASGDETLVLAMKAQTDTSDLDSDTKDASMTSGDETMVAESTESDVSSADVYKVSVPLSKMREKSMNLSTALTPIKRQPALQDGFYAPTPVPPKWVAKPVSKTLKTLQDNGMSSKNVGPGKVNYFGDSPSSSKKVRFCVKNQPQDQRYFSDS